MEVIIPARQRPVDNLRGNGKPPGSLYDVTMTASAHHPSRPAPRSAPQPFGDHLRHWRQHRRLSQLDLADEAEISTRHLSFVETGRSVPSREMVLRLSERLDMPLRERNALLVAAGYAPMYRERPLDDPALASARAGGGAAAQKPRALPRAGGGPALEPGGAQPHAAAPAGRRRRVAAAAAGERAAPEPAPARAWRRASSTCRSGATTCSSACASRSQATADAVLAALLEELKAYPVPEEAKNEHLEGEHPGVLMPFLFKTPAGMLSFISTTTIFGTPVDVTLQELAMETFFPADDFTRQALHALAAQN
jgi:transcriptional regulator with XRE-family HTH domain